MFNQLFHYASRLQHAVIISCVPETSQQNWKLGTKRHVADFAPTNKQQNCVVPGWLFEWVRRVRLRPQEHLNLPAVLLPEFSSGELSYPKKVHLVIVHTKSFINWVQPVPQTSFVCSMCVGEHMHAHWGTLVSLLNSLLGRLQIQKEKGKKKEAWTNAVINTAYSPKIHTATFMGEQEFVYRMGPVISIRR